MTLLWACEPFITPDDLLDAEGGCVYEDGDPVEEWIDIASDMLYHLSDGWITGRCARTVRPTLPVDVACAPWPRMVGYGGGVLLGVHPTTVAHEPWLELRGPNASVSQVKIDGVILDPSQYVLLDGYRLVRTSGDWPTRNDIRLPDTAVGTWSITVGFGNPIDRITRAAAIEMTQEMARADSVGDSPVFPAGVIGANVQGVSVAIDDVTEALQEGRELLPKTSRFISMFGGRGTNSALWSPETDSYRLVEVRQFP